MKGPLSRRFSIDSTRNHTHPANAMIVTVTPRFLSGKIPAIASKSYAHRLLIAAALSESPAHVSCSTRSEDIDATCRVLRGLSARVTQRNAGDADVLPIDRDHLPVLPEVDCGESGTTLRYLIPVAAALGCGAKFICRGRLPSRPVEPLAGELKRHGIRLTTLPGEGFVVEGKLAPGAYSLPGNVSSQFIGGLLYALAILEGTSTLAITKGFESEPYVRMTLEVLEAAGVAIREEKGPEGLPVWTVAGRGKLHAGPELVVEGDWSNAAFWLAAGALAGDEGETIEVTGIRRDSLQGDRAVAEILARFGARVIQTESATSVMSALPGALRGIEIDAAQIPDLVPILAVVAGAASGTTRFTNAGRLRIKESDRLKSTSALLSLLGVPHEEEPAGLVVHGLGSAGKFRGGEIQGFGDHRIVMAAAVAAASGGAHVRISGAEAFRKSYPKFLEDFAKLGGLCSAE